MSTVVLRPTLRVRPLLIAGIVAAVAAVVVLVAVLGSDDGPSRPTVRGPAEAPFTMRLADRWKPVAAAELAQLPGSPLAVVRSADGSGTVVISRSARSELPVTEMAAGLKRRLKARFADLREVSAKVMTLPAGRAFVYSFARTRAGIAQTLAIVSAGSSTYSINAVVRSGTPSTAREVGAMLGTFDVR